MSTINQCGLDIKILIKTVKTSDPRHGISAKKAEATMEVGLLVMKIALFI
jgi:hypothetical protein